MEERLRPVALAVFVGMLSIIFGISWAIYLETQHEAIHQNFEKGLTELRSKFVVQESAPAPAAHSHGAQMKHDMPQAEKAPLESEKIHNDPALELAHRMLTRGHLHSMGLGLVTIAVSLLLAFIAAPGLIKTIASLLVAAGGFLYPFTWIIMGYRTPWVGPDAAEASLEAVVGFAIVLVLSGLVITAFYAFRNIFKKG